MSPAARSVSRWKLRSASLAISLCCSSPVAGEEHGELHQRCKSRTLPARESQHLTIPERASCAAAGAAASHLPSIACSDWMAIGFAR